MRVENDMLRARNDQARQDYHALRVEHEDLQARHTALEQQLASLGEQSGTLQQQLTATKETVSTIQDSERRQLAQELLSRSEQVESLKQEQERLQNQIGELNARLFDMEIDLKSTTSAQLSAESSLTQANADLGKVTDRATELETSLTTVRAELDKTGAEALRLAAALAEAQKDRETLTAEVGTLKEQIRPASYSPPALTEAAPGIYNSGLRRYFDDGSATVQARSYHLVISLSSDDLFQPATVKLSDRGLQMLGAARDAIRDLGERPVTVTGHTDNVPIGRMPYADNWELAAARACEVTRWLTAQPGFASERFTAASRAYFDPMGPNETTDGRRKNRRVDIVVDFQE